jgi:polar amino acid transport system ATP-binding protein
MTMSFRPATPESSPRPIHGLGFAREVGNPPVLVDDGVMVEAGDPGALLAGPQRRRTTASVGKGL